MEIQRHNQKNLINSRTLGLIILIDLVLISLWVICLVFTAKSFDSMDTALAYAKQPDIMFFLTYFNAVMLTIFTILWFIGLYLYFKPHSSWLPLVGTLFVPIYGILNLFAYGSQITILPFLVEQLSNTNYQTGVELLIVNMTQAYNYSIVIIINLSAYVVLAIPSIIWGREFIVRHVNFKMTAAGWILIISAVVVMVSYPALFIGEYTITGIGSITGGFLTFIVQILLCYVFLIEKIET